MAEIDIAWRRQINQKLVGEPFGNVEAAVRGLCCVQAQDYYGAGWALGLRTQGVTAAVIDRLLEEGAILRTHILRPTWHFVLPEDIRWIQRLTSPRVHALNAGLCRREGLDRVTLDRSAEVTAQALRGGNQLTRGEIGVTLQEAGIIAAGLRLVCLLMHAELEQVICSGGRRGKEFTYALLEERAPIDSSSIDRSEALARLAERYLQCHSPATAQDFAWWSGLTVTDARAGFEALGDKYNRSTIDGKTFLLTADDVAPMKLQSSLHLLPNYDELFVGYADRTAAIDPAVYGDRDHANVAFLGNVITVDARVRGTWRRTIGRKQMTLQTDLFDSLTDVQTRALKVEAERYADFHGLPLVMV